MTLLSTSWKHGEFQSKPEGHVDFGLRLFCTWDLSGYWAGGVSSTIPTGAQTAPSIALWKIIQSTVLCNLIAAALDCSEQYSTSHKLETKKRGGGREGETTVLGGCSSDRFTCHYNSALNVKCHHLWGEGGPCSPMKPLFGATVGKIWEKLDWLFSWGWL